MRKEERPDGYALREATRAEIETLYGEYLAPKRRQGETQEAPSDQERPAQAPREITRGRLTRHANATRTH